MTRRKTSPTTIARLTGVAPVLLTRNIIEAVEYWREKVGFEAQLFGEPVNFAIMERDGIRVMIAQMNASDANTPNWKIVRSIWNAYIWVDDVDALYAELQQRGAIIDYTIGNKPYGCREFGIQDLDGHDIGFGQVIR